MPKLTIKRWTEPGTTVQRVRYTTWPATSWRIITGLRRIIGWNAEGSFQFDWHGNIHRIEDEDA